MCDCYQEVRPFEIRPIEVCPVAAGVIFD